MTLNHNHSFIEGLLHILLTLGQPLNLVMIFIKQLNLDINYQKKRNIGLKIAGNLKPTEEVAALVAPMQHGDELFINGKWVATYGIGATNKIEKSVDDDLFLAKL